MFCRKCGTQIRLNAKFCHKCGAPVPVGRSSETVSAEKSGSGSSAKDTGTEDVKTLFKRSAEEETRAAAPEYKEKKAPEPIKTEVKKEETPELIIHMAERKESSSNGQFEKWFSDPGGLE